MPPASLLFPAFSLRTASLALSAVVLTGCISLAPAPDTPPLPVPEAWPAHLGSGTDGAQAGELAWQAYFTDPLLQRLIETALENNRDLRLAALRVEEASAAFRIQRSDRFPAVGVGAQGGRARVPGDLNMSGRSQVGGEYRAEVGLSTWELDLWGRVRNLEDAALQSWLASDAARQAVHLALIAQVADGYLGLREIDERVAIARQTVATREESYRIFRRRVEVGSTSKLDLTQVQTLLNQAQALLTQLEQARATQLHALALLVGADPGPLPTKAPFDETTVLAELRAGLPSELLVSRPDIISAEHQLRAGDANIGEAARRAAQAEAARRDAQAETARREAARAEAAHREAARPKAPSALPKIELVSRSENASPAAKPPAPPAAAKPPRPQPPQEPVASAPTRGGGTVVGSFAIQENAYAVRDDYRNQNIRAGVERVTVNGRTLYQVRIWR